MVENSRSTLAEKWRKHLAELDIQVDLYRKVADLPIETQQSIEITRAPMTEAKVLILDEPTAVFCPTGIETPFKQVRRLKSLCAARDRGAAILLISSDLDEIFDISDRVVVMLPGRINGEFPLPKISTRWVRQ